MTRPPLPPPRRLWRAWVVIAIVAAAAPTGRAQFLPEADELVHRHARTGYPTIHVYVWGAADLPGIWEVEESVDLVEVLTVARLRGVGEAQSEIDQETSVRVYRRDGGEGRTLIFATPLDSLLTPTAAAPPLEDGDVVAIEVTRSRSFGWRDVSTVVGTLSSLALLLLRLL